MRQRTRLCPTARMRPLVVLTLRHRYHCGDRRVERNFNVVRSHTMIDSPKAKRFIVSALEDKIAEMENDIAYLKTVVAELTTETPPGRADSHLPRALHQTPLVRNCPHGCSNVEHCTINRKCPYLYTNCRWSRTDIRPMIDAYTAKQPGDAT